MTKVERKQFLKIPSSKWLLLFIPLLYTILLLYYPAIGFLKLSFFDENGFTFQYLTEVLTNTLYLQVLWGTVKIAFLVTVISLIISYPISYLITVTESGGLKKLILGTITITLWISLLVRTFTWTVILQSNGIVNQILIAIGLIEEPIQLVYNFTGIVIGMTHVLIPYMVISLYSVMEGIDLRLLQAAKGLGARPSMAFLQIFLPLSLRGIISGSLIVFVLSLGYFITPALLGGGNYVMISNLIQQNVQMTLNWHLASALSVLLLVATFVILGAVYWISNFSPNLKGEGE